MLEIVLHPEAEEELNTAVNYYEECKDGLGLSFLHEVEKGFKNIQDNPSSWGIITKDIRRYLIHRFPYAIIYRLTNGTIVVLAVAHLHRKPKYWKERI
jgi:plasmid stabilization system protein ParE